MSHSPLEQARVVEEDPYAAGWNAVIRLARRGDSWSGHERNACFLNLGGAPGAGAAPRFVDVAGVLGLDHPDDGRAAARLDLDFDGDEDLVVSARTSPRLRLLANRVADGARHLGVRLVGSRSNRDGIGAVVTARALDASGAPSGGPPQIKSRRAGEGYLAQSSGVVRFGFGRDAGLKRAHVTVRWPGETVPEDFGAIDLDRVVTLVEGRGRAVESGAASAVQLAPRALDAEATPTEAHRIVLAAPHAIPALTVTSPSGRVGQLFGATPDGPRGSGRATLVLVFASWCAPCLTELREFGDARLELAQLGLDVIALGADSEADWPIAETALASAGWRGPVFRASPEALEVLDAVLEDVRFRPTRMPLPTSFLLGPDGALVAVHVGATTPTAARADLQLSMTPVDRRADLATPFRGTWRTRPDAGVDPRRLAPETLSGRLASRGLEGPRRELELARTKVVATAAQDPRLAVAGARMQQGTLESVTQALEIYDAVLAEQPKELTAHSGRAFALSVLGRHADAAEAWRAYLRESPASPEGRASLALALAAADRRAEALAEVAALRALATPRARELAAQVEAALGNSDGQKPNSKE